MARTRGAGRPGGMGRVGGTSRLSVLTGVCTILGVAAVWRCLGVRRRPRVVGKPQERAGHQRSKLLPAKACPCGLRTWSNGSSGVEMFKVARLLQEVRGLRPWHTCTQSCSVHFPTPCGCLAISLMAAVWGTASRPLTYGDRMQHRYGTKADKQARM